MHTLLKSKKTD